MKYLFVSRTGGNLSLAMRVSSEGHYTAFAGNNSIGNGLLHHYDWTTGQTLRGPLAEVSPDIVVFDEPSVGTFADSIRSRGYQTVFSSRWSHALENEDYKKRVLAAVEIPYTDKPLGHFFTIEGWFNGNKFIAILLAYMYTTLFPGGVGPHVNYMGSVVYGKLSKHDKLYQQTLAKLETQLRQVDYRGHISIDVVVDKDTCKAVNIHAKPRIGTTHTFFEGTKRDISDVLHSLALGSNAAVPLDDWIVSVGLSVPPWPHSAPQSSYKLGGVNTHNSKHLWLSDAFMDENGVLWSGTTTGFIGSVTARGKTMREARRRCYRTISNLKVPDLQYRNDIAQSAEAVFEELFAEKWLQGA